MKQAIIFLMILSTLFLPYDFHAAEQPFTKTIEAIGTGRVYGQNVAVARSQAIAAGLVSALEKVVLDFLPIESSVQNFRVLNESLYEHTGKFIQNYRVLTEAISADSYRVIVQATIAVDQVAKQLAAAGVVSGDKSVPRVLLFITEQNPAGTLTKYWWREDADIDKSAAETGMAKAMKDAGLLIVEYHDIIEYIKKENIKLKAVPDPLKAVHLGARFHADIVILGQGIADSASNAMGREIRSFQGTLAARAYRTDTGEEIASTAQTSIAVNVDAIAGGRDALLSAGTLAGDKLASEIINTWQAEIKREIPVEIVIEGTAYLSSFAAFRNILTDLPGVNHLQLREMSVDKALISLNFHGNTKELADELLLKNYESFGINIYEISENSLHIGLIPLQAD